MNDLYTRLVSTNKTNEKIKILQEYQNDDIVKNALQLCYDPFAQSYIKKIPNVKSNGCLTFREAFPKFQRLFNDLSTRLLSGTLATETVKMFLRSINDNDQHLFIKILQKDMKVQVGTKTLLKAFGDDFIHIFTVQLANQYDKNVNYDTNFWFASRKLNGLRGYYSNQSNINKYDLRTRGGHEMFGFNHILNELNILKNEHNLSFIDGEMYSHNIPFQTIQSYVMQEKNINPQFKNQIKFNIFAIGKNWKDTEEMIQYMNNIKWEQFTYLKPIEYIKIENDVNKLSALMYQFYNENYEGLMLRHPIIWYNWKRSNYLVKFKPFKEADFTIVGFENGKDGGLNENTLGAVIVEGEYEDKKIRAKIGSGYKLLEEQGVTRDYIWKNKEKLLYKQMEVNFQTVTDKPRADGTYSLQFPTFSKLKLDR